MLGRIRQAKKMSLFKPVEFPLILGRDFSGEIVARGTDVPKDLNVGDLVMGVVTPYQQGCHSELVVVTAAQVRIIMQFKLLTYFLYYNAYRIQYSIPLHD